MGAGTGSAMTNASTRASLCHVSVPRAHLYRWCFCTSAACDALGTFFVVVVDLFASLGQSHAQREDVSVLAFWWLTQILNWLLDAWSSAAKW